jgi:hypothetical protein
MPLVKKIPEEHNKDGWVKPLIICVVVYMVAMFVFFTFAVIKA